MIPTYGVLGPFQIRQDDQWQPISMRHVARLATLLAGWPGELIERERLAYGIWGDEAPATVGNTLQAHVSQLRRIVGKGTVQCEGTSYRLDVDPSAVDAELFTELIGDAARMRRRQHHARAAELLASAQQMWRGMPYPDVHDPDLQARRARLEELRDQALEDLLESRLELCRDEYDLAGVIADAKELVTRHPLREKGHVVLVRALLAADRPGEAGEAFQRAAENLRSAMGLDPSRALVEVHTNGLTGDAAVLPRAMRTITLIPPAPAPSADAEQVAERARQAVTDIGPPCTTVIVSDSCAGQDLATTVAGKLRMDAPYGVLVCDGSELTSAVLADLLSETTGITPIDVTSFPHMSGLVLVIHDAGPAVKKMLKAMDRWSTRPVVVAIAAQPLGVDGEYVIASEATALKRKASAAASPPDDADALVPIGA